MNEVSDFLSSHPSYSFEEGFALIRKYDTNPGVISFLEQRRDMNHLGYELGRLARHPILMPVPGYQEPTPAVETQAANKVRKPKKEVKQDIIKWEDLKQRHENTKYDDMPTDYLKGIWKENQSLYKELRYVHSQMKQANSDAGRADWRQKMLEIDGKLRTNWKTIDEEISRLNSGDGASDDDGFKESTCRSYITRKLGKKNLTANDIVEIRRRYELLVKHNCIVSDETTNKLKELKVL